MFVILIADAEATIAGRRTRERNKKLMIEIIQAPVPFIVGTVMQKGVEW